MARHIKREREIKVQRLAQLPDALVQPALDIPVSFITVVTAQHRQQIRGTLILVFAQQGFERGLYLYLKQLVRFAPPVNQHVSPDIFFPQVAHIHERHAAREQAEPEEVTRQLLVLVLTFQVKAGDLVDLLLRNRALGRLAAFQLDPVERMAGVVDQSLVIGFVVNGAKLFYIEHDRIGIIALLLPEVNEVLDSLFGKYPPGEDTTADVTFKSIYSAEIIGCRAVLAGSFKFGDFIVSVNKKVTPVITGLEGAYNIGDRCIRRAPPGNVPLFRVPPFIYKVLVDFTDFGQTRLAAPVRHGFFH